MTAFAQWLQLRMDARGVNQSQLAAYLETKPSTVGAWFTDDRLPSTAFCWRLAKYLHEPIETVLRAAGHLPPLDTPEPEVEIIEELGVVLRTFTPQEQRRFALPAIELAAQLLRETRAEYEAVPPADEAPPHPGDAPPRRRPGPSQP